MNPGTAICLTRWAHARITPQRKFRREPCRAILLSYLRFGCDRGGHWPPPRTHPNGPLAGLFYWPQAEWKDESDEQGNERRRNGDRSARRSGREAHLRLSRRRGAADLRRHLLAG